jgi:molybdopterin/thiamine biosynthesis adenylyltransferase/rhodanese-related sulfurtransferase
MASNSNDRYARQMILPGWGEVTQNRLAQARVLLLGLGGLGSPAARYLAAAGVGHLGLVDFDQVDESNLHRQILYQTPDIGHSKVEVAARELQAVRPDLSLECFSAGLALDELVGVFGRYDVILDGTDNFPSRYAHNDAAFFAGKPLVSGSILRWEGQVTVYDPSAGGPCLRCLFPEPPPPGAVPNCAEAGVIGALCGIVGSWQALEAIKLITGLGEPSRGILWAFDALQPSWKRLRLKKDARCPLCGETPSIHSVEAIPGSLLPTCRLPLSPASTPTEKFMTPLEITVHDAKALLEAEGESTFLLDVREEDEWETSRLAGATLIPMQEIPHRLSEVPAGKRILVLCHHGGRSAAVTRFLRQQGYDTASNIKGGIDAWALQIDSSLPRY